MHGNPGAWFQLLLGARRLLRWHLAQNRRPFTGPVRGKSVPMYYNSPLPHLDLIHHLTQAFF